MITTSDRQSEVVGDVESDADRQPPSHPTTTPPAPTEPRRTWYERAWLRRTVVGSVAVLCIGVGSAGAGGTETVTKTVTETEVEEVPAAVTAEQRQVYIDQGVEQGRADAEAEQAAALEQGRADAEANQAAAVEQARQEGRDALLAEQAAASAAADAAAASAAVGPGRLIVGQDIMPGRYTTTAGDDIMSSVYWARLSSLDGGSLDNIIDNGNAQGQTTVEILPTDVAFETDGTWTPAG